MLTSRCGSTEPGIAATASRNSSTSAVRMLVSCRQSAQERQRRRTRRLDGAGLTATRAPGADAWPAARSTKSSQPPVTSASPTTMSSAPPTRVTQRLLRRTARNSPSSLRKPSPNDTNGRPSPRQYATREHDRPVGLSRSTVARPSTAPSVGPVHGTQDSANTAPKHRRADQPGRRQPADPPLPLQARDQPEEGQPEHDDQHADDDLHASACASAAPRPTLRREHGR